MKLFELFFVLFMSSVGLADVLINRTTSIAHDSEGFHPALQSLAHPDPQPGYKIVVIRPTLNFEKTQKIEITFAERMMSDCVDTILIGNLEEKELLNTDAGYKYYELTMKDGSIVSMCSNRLALRSASIDFGVELFDIRSEFVLYVPNEVNVTYRIWEPGPVLYR